MILAIDVDYRDDYAVTAGVTFTNWDAATENDTFISINKSVKPYISGQFYQRELPCILQLLAEHQLKPDCIVVDGYVFLDGISEPGLGKYLYDALCQKNQQHQIPIIGVAKNKFVDIPESYGILRGESQKPLFVTSVGVDPNEAKETVLKMHGAFRFPTLLKLVDSICRRAFL